MTGRWKIASIRGIPIYLASSFVWIAALVTYSMYLRFWQGSVTITQTAAVALALFAAALFFGSILLHELAHAVVARAFDLPVRAITLVFWGGATETKADLKGPKGEFLVSGAGPATSLLLGGLLVLLSRALDGAAPLPAEALGLIGGWNVLLAGLNAIPGFPLDGGRMLLAGVWAVTKDKTRGTRAAGYGGMAVGLGFAALGFFQFTRGNGFSGIWFFFLASILISTARGTEARIRLRALLAQGRAADAMRQPPATVPAAASLGDVLRDYLRDHEQEAFPVVDDGRVIGLISMSSSRRLGARDPMRPARDGMAPLSTARVVGPADTLDEVIEVLGGHEGMVLEGGTLLGAIGPEDVDRWYQARLRGEQPAAAGGIPPRPDR